jgi:hypothetical protein
LLFHVVRIGKVGLKKTEQKAVYFFVDESGDPNFYGKGGDIIIGKPGCSRVLLLGFVRVEEPEPIRQSLAELREKIVAEEYLKGIPSLKKTFVAFHAKDDCPEVRMMVYKTLAQHNFAAQVIVARKIERMFRSKYKGSRDKFYEDLVGRLFQNETHKVETNNIVFSKRGNKIQQHTMRAAIELGAERFRQKWGTDVSTQLNIETRRSSKDLMLQVVDYTNWAVQRAFERGEMRFFNYLRDKFELVVDIFDKEKYKGGGNFYDRSRNPFDIKKASPLG